MDRDAIKLFFKTMFNKEIDESKEVDPKRALATGIASVLLSLDGAPPFAPLALTITIMREAIMEIAEERGWRKAGR